MSESKSAGDYTLKIATLKSYDGNKKYDIANIIYAINLTESIDDYYISGSVSVVDTSNFLDNFPILGEESLDIVMEDFFGEEYTWRLRIVSVSPVTLDSIGTKLDYSFSVVSRNFIETDNREIRRSFKGSVSDIATKVFDEYFETDLELDIDTTNGSQTFVIPCKTPFETMDFLSRKSFSLEFPSSSFRFFETRNDFKFTTMEGLIKRGKDKPLDDKRNISYEDPKLHSSDPFAAMRNMISFKPINRINILSEMRRGGMVNELTLLDLGQKTVEEKLYKHYENVNDIVSTDENTMDYHTKDFIRDNFQKENTMARYIVYNDTTKPDQYYENILPRRLSSEYYMDNISVQFQMYGSFDIELGDLIFLTLPKPEVARDSEDNKTLSGWYIVRKMKHVYGIDDWKTDFLCVKSALKGDFK
tara:strand:- start:9466 stop:10716 length:1251 start_codon:yes stop_codon:yes gene_type:complete